MIVLTALAANLGAIPTVSDEVAVYGQIFDHVAPLGIFLLLLQVRLSGLSNVGLPLLGLFLAGSAGTMLGVVCGLWVAGGNAAFGAMHAALGGMFVGTYTGGSLNFTAVALETGVVEQGPLFAGAAVVDSAMTTVWLSDGVAATYGPVAEPYLLAFADPSEFFGLILTGRFSLVEAYYYTKPFNSWMMLLVADPLYRPFAANPQLKLDDVIDKNVSWPAGPTTRPGPRD